MQIRRHYAYLVNCFLSIELTGEVMEDFFPEGDEPPSFEDTVVNGHLLLQWNAKDFTVEGLPIEGDLQGIWNYWFEDGEITRSQGRGEFPFSDS